MTTSQSPDSLTALRELLAKSSHLGSLSEVAESLVPERRHTLLRRSAIPIVFDEAMVRTVLIPNLPAPDDKTTSDPGADVSWLLGHSDIERVGGSEPLYRMRADIRATRLEKWFAPNEKAKPYSDVVDAVTLSKAIVDFLSTGDGAPRDGWVAEQLYHLSMADPDRAAKRLDEMYRAADAEFDVPACYRVLQTIGGQRALLVRHRDQRGQPADRRQAITRLVETHDALQQYYEARCAFAGDLAKSAHALEREFMKDEWARIQRINTTSGSSVNTPEPEWIIDLTAQGGMGKTIFLQWLASRKCLPNRVPYARIDFDFTDPTVLPEAPWLVLVRLAEQLNTQIAGRPFSGFIEKYDEYASIARDLAVEGRAQHTGEILGATGEQRLGRQVTDDFADTLRDTVGGAVVIVLDTLEDVIRRRTTNLLAVITCLSNVHSSYPNLRLVLAGRFDLRDDSKLKGFNAAFGSVTREVQVHRFEIEESVNYLVAVRGLPDGDPVRAMAECSRGLPFALSLYADEWQLGGAMTAEQVRASPNPELKYLVNRVLGRIEASDQALCWLLRYGVVPRQLTKSFARDVLLPEMEAALGGGSPHDDPSRDADPLHPYYAAQQTALSAAPAIDIDDLWGRLEAYASTLSFVRADADRDTVVFHEDAVRPMRRELQRQPVFRRLQQRAATYYARLAREVESQDTGRWVRATRAMLFHKFQLGGADAERSWRRAIQAALGKHDARLVFDVATELTQPEYLDDDRKPIIREDGAPVVTSALLRDALIARARSALQLGASSGGLADVDWWAEAERALDDLDALARREPELALNHGTLAVMRAQIDARYGNADDALKRLEAVRPTMTSRADRMELAVALGGVFATREEPAAIDHFSEAIRLAEGDPDIPPRQLLELRQLLATHCTLHDRYDLAVEQLLQVRSRLRRGSIERCQVTARLADAWLSSDDPRQAIGAARNAWAECETALAALKAGTAPEEHATWLATRAELETLEARALAAVGDHPPALARLDAALSTANELSSLSSAGAGIDMHAAVAQARARSMRGAVLSVMARHGAALDELETARQLWAQSVKRVEQSATDLHEKVQLLLYRVGNLKLAEQHLNEAERISLPPRGDAWSALRVDAVRLDDAQHCADDAAKRLRNALSPDTQRIPRVDVRVAAGALSLERAPGVADGYGTLLARAVDRISPPSAARVALSAAIPDLAPLTCMPLGDAGRALASALGLGCDVANPPSRSLTSWARLDRARMAFALGARDDARRWLASVTARALTRAPATTVAFAHYLECEMQVPEAERQAREASLAFIATPGDARVLAGVVATREATLLARSGRKDDARAMADLAAPLLAVAGEVPSIWSARCDELRADLAATPDDKQHFVAEAISRYEALGQREAASRLRERRGPPKYEETVSGERPPIVVTLSASGMDVVGEISVERDNAGPAKYMATATGSPALDHLRSDLEAAKAQAIPYQVSRLLADEWFTAIRDLGALLGPRSLWDARLGDASKRDGAPVDVRLEVVSPVLDTLPLECLAEQTDEPAYLTVDRRVGTLYRSVRVVDARRTHVTWVQRALASIMNVRIFADGIEGPQTRGAVMQFQKSVGLVPTGQADGPTSALLFDRLRRVHRGDVPLRALVLAPAPEVARSTGAEEEAAADRLARVYEEAGFETTVREGVTVAELRELCTEFHPEVIHVRAPLRESASLGGIVLDARAPTSGDNVSAARGDALTPSGVTRALGQTRWPDRPIVVLDPSRGRGRTQAMHQLLLRNGFAADLFRQGTAVAVLGVGLGEPDLHARVTRTIAESFARGRSLSALAAELREMPGGATVRPVDMTFESMLPTVGVALWAYDPSLVYLAAPTPAE
ncbi:MAG TPA: peptidoglycan-binding domain-containing protein [Gemmatimonadaceae bacterium]|nr:peptidoglycan-binding domain-containing protein [Gemmatimonadaceae bacterium]